jgi:formate-dependent nitrite reductase cytochrome c552 subunit
MKERAKSKDSAAAKQPKTAADANIQGEGDYAADRRYRERTDHFLKTADVEEVARAAAPKSKAEAREMAAAEQEGRDHAHLPPRRGTKQGAKPRGGHGQ